MGVGWCSLGWLRRHSLSIENPILPGTLFHPLSLSLTLPGIREYISVDGRNAIAPPKCSSKAHKPAYSTASKHTLSFVEAKGHRSNNFIGKVMQVIGPFVHSGSWYIAKGMLYTCCLVRTVYIHFLLLLLERQRGHLRANIITHAYLYRIKNHPPLKCIDHCIAKACVLNLPSTKSPTPFFLSLLFRSASCHSIILWGCSRSSRFFFMHPLRHFCSFSFFIAKMRTHGPRSGCTSPDGQGKFYEDDELSRDGTRMNFHLQNSARCNLQKIKSPFALRGKNSKIIPQIYV